MQNFSNATIEGFVTHDPLAKTTKTGKISMYICPGDQPLL